MKETHPKEKRKMLVMSYANYQQLITNVTKCHQLFIILLAICMTHLAYGQRPLLNHTSLGYNSINLAQQNNYLGSGKQLRNGRVHVPLPQQPTQSAVGLPFDDFDINAATDARLSSQLGSRLSSSRRRINLSAGPGGSGAPGSRPERNNGRRGIDSLRKELMKPSQGGPGGGISGSSIGYPSYSATSSIGKIDGIGSLGPADRYGDKMRPGIPLAGNNNVADNPDKRPSSKKSLNAISEIIKLTKTPLGHQGDQPIDGTHHPDDDILQIDDEHDDPIEAIKQKIRITNPKSGAYEAHTESAISSEIEDQLGVKCTFETPCAWKWVENLVDGFQVLTGAELHKKNMTGLLPGPIADSRDDANGHFLYARLLPTTLQVNLTSPQFSTTLEKCYLEIYMHQSDMSHGLSRIVVEPLHSHEGSWVPSEIVGDNYKQWGRKTYRLGRISRDFRLVFEIVPKLVEGHKAHVAIDNLRMVNCFPEGTKSEKCSTSQVKCMYNKVPVCIPLPRICDITKDCDDAEDELLNCDKIPYGGRCDFENDWCGWHDSAKTILEWSRHTGASPTHDTGPDGDHTNQHLLNATGGYYMLVNMNQHSNNSEKGSLIGFASNAILMSKVFNPPPLVHGNPNSPYRNSCVVRFYIHQFGKNPGSINLSVVEMKEKENITTTLWWSTKNQGSEWLRAEYVLPNITSKYYLQFEARMGMRIFSDVAVDDFSLSPECFGLNIPKEHLNGYNYWDVRHNLKSPSHRDFEHKHYLELTTCDTRGMIGPSQTQCEEAYKTYNNSHVLKEVHVVEEPTSYKGMQKWKVPHEGYYTIIAKGASGGLGSGGVGSSRGAIAVTVLELHKSEELFILVGQQGENACIKSINLKEEACGDGSIGMDLSKYSFDAKQHLVKNINIQNGAGGGGGGSYVFLLNSAKNEAVPLIVAGGGGGLGIGRYIDEDFQHGQKANPSRPGVTGQINGEPLNTKTAGPGGGWRAKADQALSPIYGAALLQGGRGGHSCYAEINNNGSSVKRFGQGGFGGGGGGCSTGGGGGGYAGGDVYLNESNGEGGTSFISLSRSLKDFSMIYDGASSGAGSVIIIPAIEGCGCDYRCIALDEYRSSVKCICPEGWRVKRDNNTACEMLTSEGLPFPYLVGIFAFLLAALVAALSCVMVMLYNRYQRKKDAQMRHKMLLEQDLQLSRLRHNIDDTNLTNFNPNYGCDGILNGNVDVKNLPQVARENLRLIKALGQGAFGEVYEGLYRHHDGDAVGMKVAVKTLPEMSTKQAEEDFLMEAAIMAKFKHPNIVHFIGVCFDRHPRFIVLELLAGGDLKNFLREGRNKPERPSPLTMKDLVFCALDVAKGCRYMESKRFIHRDIAARNCLLSSKGPGRVVKIADFGMARDIYRSDYYRKGGKAMLPIKWMPPEAFLDGIFTSKTDVWSFGVLLWEVFSLGLMPYTGLPNPEVMQLVTNGGRLGAPPGCPTVIYRIMADCWNPTPEDRPTFSSLLERLTECTQDLDVMNAPLPSIFRPTSTERDQTVMRPPGGDEFCLPVPQTSDYLVPLPGIRPGGDYTSGVTANQHLPSSSNVCTPPAISSPSAPTTDINAPTSGAAVPSGTDDEGGCWETSFILPNSKSDQPLLSGNTSDSQRSIQRSPIMKAAAAASTAANTPAATTTQSNGPIQPNQNNVTSMRHDNPEDYDEEAKLISLDTPQPTPTTIQPPLSFSSQLDGITLDPAALTKSLHNNKTTNGTCTPNNVATTANKSYANIQMMTTGAPKLTNGCANISSAATTATPAAATTTATTVATTNDLSGSDLKMNGSIPGMNSNSNINNSNNNNNNNNNNNCSTTINGVANGSPGGNTTTPPPFTIQGYAERFKDKHSEISC